MALLLASAVVTAWGASQERRASSWDRAIPATDVSCEGGVDCIWVLAFRYDLPLGVEVDDARSEGTPLSDSRSWLHVPATTTRDLLNDFVQANPRYEWREIDGYAVLRPKSAWGDRDDILDRPVAPFDLVDSRLDDALGSIYKLVRLDLGGEVGVFSDFELDQPDRFSVHFAGGSLLEALTAAERALGPFRWRVTRRTSTTSKKVYWGLTLNHRPRKR